MQGTKFLFSKNLLTNTDIAEYYKNLEAAENTLRSSYHGKDSEKENQIMGEVKKQRLAVISELESGNPISDTVKKGIIKTLENILFIAKFELSKGTFEGTTEGVQKYLDDIKRS